MRARHAPRASQMCTVSEPDIHRACTACAPGLCGLWSWCRWRLRLILEFNLYLFKYSIMSPQACMMSSLDMLKMTRIAL